MVDSGNSYRAKNCTPLREKGGAWVLGSGGGGGTGGRWVLVGAGQWGRGGDR